MLCHDASYGPRHGPHCNAHCEHHHELRPATPPPSQVATRQLPVLFGCEEVALFWVDQGMECLWRFHTSEEKLENEKLKKVNPFGPREMVPFSTPCLATEGLKKVNMSGDEEQFVINVANSLKHPKFNAQIDGKSTISSLLVPIARQTGDKKSICVVQLRNKEPKNIHTKKGSLANKSAFRTDDINFLQYFALNSSTLFEEALDLQKAKETDEYLEQSQYCVQACNGRNGCNGCNGRVPRAVAVLRAGRAAV